MRDRLIMVNMANLRLWTVCVDEDGGSAGLYQKCSWTFFYVLASYHVSFGANIVVERQVDLDLCFHGLSLYSQ